MSNERRIQTCADICQTLEELPAEDGDIRAWLEKQATDHKLGFLLAFALDGVIWGKVEDGKLIVAYDIEKKHWAAAREAVDEEGTKAGHHAPSKPYSAALRPETLQEARLFGPNSELHIWCQDGQWRGRLIGPGQAGEAPAFREFIEEATMLWGNLAEPLGDSGFTLLADGAQGLRHAPPVELDGGRYPQGALRLVVRHYLADEPVARIVASRLVRLAKSPERKAVARPPAEGRVVDE